MKKTLTRVVCFALALCMALGLVACGSAASTSTPASESGSAAASGSVPEMIKINYSEGIDDTGFWTGIRASDYVTLPKYEGIEIPEDKVKATAEEIDAIKKNMLQPYGTMEQLKEGTIEDGTTVNIDYVGSVDGVEFVGGNTEGKGTNVTIGVTQYVDDFLQQLVGHKPGDTLDVEVTFPEDYNDSTDKDGNAVVLKGKDAIFKTTINYIAGEMQYPEFDDNFVASYLSAQYGWNNLEEADAGIVKNIEEVNKYNFIMSYLDENSKVTEVPEIMTDSMIKINLESAKNAAAQYGMDFSMFLAVSGFADEAAFMTQLENDAELASRQRLVFQAIADKEGLTVSQDDIKAVFADDTDAIIEQYGIGFVKLSLMSDKVTELLMSRN